MRSCFILCLLGILISSTSLAAPLDVGKLKESIAKIENDLYLLESANESVELQENKLNELYLLAKDAYSAPNHAPTLADIFHQDFAAVFMAYGRYEWAIEMYQNARHLRTSALGTGAELVVRMTKNIASCYYEMELYESAIAAFDQAAKGYEKGLQENSFKLQDKASRETYLRRLGETYRFRGLSYNQTGEFQQAKRDCDKAVATFKQVANTPYLAYAFTSLSDVLTHSGKYEQARFAALKAEKFALKAKDQFELANIYNNLGNIYDLEEKHDSAILYYNKALVLDEKMGAAAFSGNTFNNIGLVYLHKNQLDPAARYFQKALQTITEVNEGVPFHYDYSAIYENIGDLYSKQKNYSAALQNYQLALINNSTDFRSTNVRENPDPKNTQLYSKPDFLRVLDLKGRAFYAQKDLSAALATFKVYDRAIDFLHHDLLREDSRLIWIERAHAVYETAISLALEAGEVEQSFLFSERGKAVLLLRQLKNLDAKALLPDSLLQAENILRRKIGVANREIFDYRYANDSTNLLKNQAKLVRYEEELKQLNQHIASKFPDYLKKKNTISSASLAEIRKSTLNQSTALLAFFAGDEEWFIFLLTKNDLRSWAIPRNATQGLAMFIRQLRSEKFHCENYGAGYHIYQNLLEKPLKTLDGNITNIVIVPDGELALLPFEVLLKEPLPDICANYDLGKMAFLLEDYAISYAYSANILLDNLKHDHYDYRFDYLGLAPKFNSTNTSNLRACNQGEIGPLQYNIEEIKNTATLYPSSTVFEGSSANKLIFGRQTRDHRIIHLATHACQNGLDTRIFLAKGNILSGKEIRGLNMQTELVVLSACETGSGTVQKGEGVMSLARDFAIAGSPSLIMSLWSVDDRSTSKLMVEVHKNLRQGFNKDEALRQAKLHYLRTAAFNREPLYWAPFVLLGNSRPIYTASNNWYWFVVLPFLLLAGVFLLKVIHRTKMKT